MLRWTSRTVVSPVQDDWGDKRDPFGRPSIDSGKSPGRTNLGGDAINCHVVSRYRVVLRKCENCWRRYSTSRLDRDRLPFFLGICLSPRQRRLIKRGTRFSRRCVMCASLFYYSTQLFVCWNNRSFIGIMAGRRRLRPRPLPSLCEGGPLR